MTGKAAKDISKKKDDLTERLEVLTSALPGKTQAEKDIAAAAQELLDYVKDLEGRLTNLTPMAKNIGEAFINSANEALNDKELNEADLR